MAHILDGDWTSTIFRDDGEIRPDSTFHLEVNEEDGTLRIPQSKHEGQPLHSGRVLPRNHIRMINHRGNEYQGILVVDVPLPGNSSLKVMCGRRRLNVIRFEDTKTGDAAKAERDAVRRDEDRKAFVDQENQVWVGTKP